MNSEFLKEYELSGGGRVVVLKPFGAQSYAAVVEQDGVYPEVGKIARNRGRRECSYILEGNFIYTVNDKTHSLSAGASIIVNDGDSYAIQGKGKVLVLVEDKQGGETEIVNAVKF